MCEPEPAPQFAARVHFTFLWSSPCRRGRPRSQTLFV